MTAIYSSNQCFNKDWFVHFYQINLINNKKLVQSKLTLPDTSISNIPRDSCQKCAPQDKM